jgi:uncharacterized protein (DUF1499 family)
MGLSSRRPAAPSRTLDILGLVAMALFLLGPLLAWLRLVPALTGLGAFALGGMLAAAVAGLVFVWITASRPRGPMINDFTTDPADPPTFKQAGSEAANAGRDLAYPAGFADQQHACCADLTPMRVGAPPPAAFVAVEAVAASMPSWRITRRDPAAGELEAVATTALFGFQDDVAFRVRPDAAGGSKVDMRSKSRDGKGDQGTNAARIRAFRDALAARAGAAAP